MPVTGSNANESHSFRSSQIHEQFTMSSALSFTASFHPNKNCDPLTEEGTRGTSQNESYSLGQPAQESVRGFDEGEQLQKNESFK